MNLRFYTSLSLPEALPEITNLSERRVLYYIILYYRHAYGCRVIEWLPSGFRHPVQFHLRPSQFVMYSKSSFEITSQIIPNNSSICSEITRHPIPLQKAAIGPSNYRNIQLFKFMTITDSEVSRPIPFTFSSRLAI